MTRTSPFPQQRSTADRLSWSTSRIGLRQATLRWTADDRQRIEEFIRRSTCCRFVPADLPSFDKLCQAADDKVFDNIRGNPHHVLHYLPPASDTSQHYNLRTGCHNYQLLQRTGHLTECNFITRTLYTETYWHAVTNKWIKIIWFKTFNRPYFNPQCNAVNRRWHFLFCALLVSSHWTVLLIVRLRSVIL